MFAVTLRKIESIRSCGVSIKQGERYLTVGVWWQLIWIAKVLRKTVCQRRDRVVHSVGQSIRAHQRTREQIGRKVSAGKPCGP